MPVGGTEGQILTIDGEGIVSWQTPVEIPNELPETANENDILTFIEGAWVALENIDVPLSLNTTSTTGIESPQNTASGSRSVALGSGTTASGWYSTAMGYNTTASGLYATASGSFSIASSDWSTAMGYGTMASGNKSTAMGMFSAASGNNSTAMGSSTTAEDYGTFAIGSFNTTDATPNPETFNLTNRAFVIGNGTSSNKSDAMTVLFDGTTNITGQVTATSFIGDGSGLTNLPGSILALNTTSTTGIESPQNTASGSRSVALGSGTTASGWYSTAMGYNTTASGLYATASGSFSIASSDWSTAMGYGTMASGNKSTAMGMFSAASGNNSTAMGSSTTAEDYGTFAIGSFNTTDATPNPETFNLTNRAFVIGNGTSSNKSDAMTVLFDGTTTIAGTIEAPALKVTSGAGAGKVLTSDAAGLASWETPSVGSSPTYTVNTFYPELGGYVFEVSPNGKHGLVVAMQNQAYHNWYVAQDMLSDAANHDVFGAEFKDWRLPTRRELNLMYQVYIGGNGANLNGQTYWSSTEGLNDSVWSLNFQGLPAGPEKTDARTARAVRAF